MCFIRTDEVTKIAKICTSYIFHFFVTYYYTNSIKIQILNLFWS